MGSGSSINWLPMGFMPGAKDSPLSHALFGASAALLAPIGFLTGKLPQQMILAGTGFGKDLNRKGATRSPLAKAGFALMRNPFYKELTKNFLSLRVIGKIPLAFGMSGNKLFSLFQERTTKTGSSVRESIASNGLLKKGLGALFGVTAPLILGGIGRSKGKGGGLGAGNFYKGMLKAFASMVIVVAIITFIVVYLNYFGAEAIGGRMHGIQMQGFSTGLFLPYKSDYKPSYIVGLNEQPSDDPSNSDGDGFTGIDFGNNPIYSGSCQQIFARVKAEYPFSTKASAAYLVTPGAGDRWCDASKHPIVRCLFSDIDPLCRDSPGSATRLFRHELTHVTCHGSEFYAELNGDNGGGYKFLAPHVMGDNRYYLATQIAAVISSKYSIPMQTLKEAGWCNPTAVSQVESKLHIETIDETAKSRLEVD
jgi:hypothetical protein